MYNWQKVCIMHGIEYIMLEFLMISSHLDALLNAPFKMKINHNLNVRGSVGF